MRKQKIQWEADLSVVVKELVCEQQPQRGEERGAGSRAECVVRQQRPARTQRASDRDHRRDQRTRVAADWLTLCVRLRVRRCGCERVVSRWVQIHKRHSTSCSQTGTGTLRAQLVCRLSARAAGEYQRAEKVLQVRRQSEGPLTAAVLLLLADCRSEQNYITIQVDLDMSKW